MDGKMIRAIGLSRRRALALTAAALTPAAARADAPRGAPAHGLAMHGAPALPADFAHLPYANPDAPKGGVLRLAFQGAFDSLNPFNLKAGSTAQGLNGNVFQTLLARSQDEAFTLYGLIAQSIETDDDRSYATFRLRPEARFADGQPMTSADVLFSFQLLKAKGRPQQRFAYALVREARVLDDATITFDLRGIGDRELPLTLGQMPVLPRHATDVERFAESSLTPPLGSGPYRIGAVKPGESLVLTRNRDYWGRDLPLHRGLYNFDEIKIDYVRDANTLFESFKAGLVDYRDETSPTRWLSGYTFPALADGRAKRAAVATGAPKGMEGLAFNMRRPLFHDAVLREALGLLFDFEWINANLYGGLYRRTKSFFDDSVLASTGRPADARERALLAPFPGAVRDDILEGTWRPTVTDGSGRDREPPRRALALLGAQGYRLVDGQLMQATTPVAFEIMVVTRDQERLALTYAQSLRRIGVTLSVRAVDEVQYQRRRQQFDYDMMFGTWVASASPGNEQRGRWGSASADQEASFNLCGVKSAAVDALIDALLAARGHEDFVSAVRAYDRVLLSGFYIVPLFHAPDQWMAWSTRLTRPDRLPQAAGQYFYPTLDTWWVA